MDALKNAYLFAPPFGKMNDPMEAFYETGSHGDQFVNDVLQPTGVSTHSFYKPLKEMTNRFALISFSTTHEYLPMWAYYASNFAGMCLEFSTAQLSTGDLKDEHLLEVEYVTSPASPINLTDIFAKDQAARVMKRLAQKRIEWRHEEEWRFVTGEVGRKHYLDDALSRVYIGPRANPSHVAAICETLAGRPVEILQGEINGYSMTFQTIQVPTPWSEAERQVDSIFNGAEGLPDQSELDGFLSVPYNTLAETCISLARHPNMEEFGGIGLNGANDALFIWTSYLLRNGRRVYVRRYYGHDMELLEN
ncbi:DUF2971 domain-containing protein [Pseudomonas sp. PB101]|nr:DUF2971 domain-containing protein [Pseudomonas sp. PB101]